jgi:peptidoglycan/LPS O-acetylase OafA/YrhL
MNTTARSRRSAGRTVIALLFVALALSAWQQVFDDVRNASNEPLAITALQTLIGALAALTSWGAWIGARWSAWLAAAYGIATAVMLVSLGPLLAMPVEERGGLLFGAAVVLVITLPCAWYLRRTTRVTAVKDPRRGTLSE